MATSRRSKPTQPTDAELRILQVVWRLGACTVRDVHEELGQDVGYTTVLKLMQIMTEKGILRRDTKAWPHRYEAVAGQDETQRQLLGSLLDRVFGGSAKGLVLRALEDGMVSREELQEIRAAINRRSRRKRSE